MLYGEGSLVCKDLLYNVLNISVYFFFKIGYVHPSRNFGSSNRGVSTECTIPPFWSVVKETGNAGAAKKNTEVEETTAACKCKSH